MQNLISILALAFVALSIGGFVFWYTNKKKQIAQAQSVWAAVVQRLGGRELPQRGVGGTRAFAVDGTLLNVMTYAGVDPNIQREFMPLGAANSWQSQVTAEVKRPVPPFEIRAGKQRGGVPTGNPGFDADWTVLPLQGAEPQAVLGLLDEQVMAALHQLRGRHYQVYSGGHNVYGLLAGIMATEAEVEALLFVCRRIAGSV